MYGICDLHYSELLSSNTSNLVQEKILFPNKAEISYSRILWAYFYVPGHDVLNCEFNPL